METKTRKQGRKGKPETWKFWETRPKPPYRRQGLAGHLTCYIGFVYQHYFNFHSLKTEFSTHAGSQLTSFDPKTWRHRRGIPTDLLSSKNMTSQTWGPNWAWCLDICPGVRRLNNTQKSEMSFQISWVRFCVTLTLMQPLNVRCGLWYLYPYQSTPARL